MGLRFGLTQALGVFDARMPRIYGRIGWKPDVIGTQEDGRDSISVGLWDISEESRQEISDRSGIPLTAVARWFELSFEANVSEKQAAA
jgi:acyl homoserine lactone synthase